MIRYRSARESSEPMLAEPEVPQAEVPERVEPVDYQVLRRPSAEASANGVFKLHPLASRVQHPVRAARSTHRLQAAAEAVEDLASEEPVERRRPIVTLVSPWTGPVEDDRKQADELEEAEKALVFDEPAAAEEAEEESVFEVPEVVGTEETGKAPVFDEPAAIEMEEEAEEIEPVEGNERIPKVIVVDRAGKLSMNLGKAAEGMVPEPEILKLDRPTEIVEIAREEDPDVIVFSPEEVTGAGLKRLAQIHKAQPRIVILLSDNDKTWSAAQMAASGASDFLPVNPSRSKLRTKLAGALHTADQLRVESVVVTERVVVQEAPPPVVQPQTSAPPTALARVFTVASASGGSGKTMLASNLATYLVKATGGRVLLIDLDLQFGEIAPSLHLHPRHSIEDLVEVPEDLASALVEHPAGFKALCAPTDPLAGERVGPNEVSAILEVARRDFDFIVVDTPPSLNETCLAVFDQSEKVIVLANMDVPSLKNMRRYLETVEKLSVTDIETTLVVNRAESGIGLDIKGVEQLFPQGFLAVLPMSKEVPWSTNMGVPILQANPKAEVSRQLAEGFAKLVPASAGETMPWSQQGGRRSGRLGLKKGRN